MKAAQYVAVNNGLFTTSVYNVMGECTVKVYSDTKQIICNTVLKTGSILYSIPINTIIIILSLTTWFFI